MLDAAEALLFGRRNELAVADERSRGIAVEGVEAEDDHLGQASHGTAVALFPAQNRCLCQRHASVMMVVRSERRRTNRATRVRVASATRIGGSPAGAEHRAHQY